MAGKASRNPIIKNKISRFVSKIKVDSFLIMTSGTPRMEAPMIIAIQRGHNFLNLSLREYLFFLETLFLQSQMKIIPTIKHIVDIIPNIIFHKKSELQVLKEPKAVAVERRTTASVTSTFEIVKELLWPLDDISTSLMVD